MKCDCPAFDDHRLVANAGLILPATLAQHLGLPQLVDRRLGPGPGPGPSQSWRQDDDPGGLRAGRRLLHRRCRRVAHRQDGWRSRLRGQGAIHPGDVPAQLPVGPRPPAGSGEQGVAGPGLGCRCRTWRRAADHRPGLHHLRDLWSGQGRGAPPQLHRPAGLSPAAGRGRWHRRGADVSAARGPRQHRSRRRPLPA